MPTLNSLHWATKSKLPRSLSMLSVLGLSFAIMAVPFGLSTTFYITLTDGQSVSVLWGWVLISLISCGIAASLAEICAVYSYCRRCVLLECTARDEGMGANRVMGGRLV